LYSICIINYNEASTLPRALESVLCQIDHRFEVIVVDSLSTDGSREILENYAQGGKIRLFEKKSSRGDGRQLAFENSHGRYIVSNLDMDDVFKPILGDLLAFYHDACEGKMLLAISEPGVWTQNVTIAPSSLISEVGGWRDIHVGEDWDLWSRAAKLGKYAWTCFALSEVAGKHPERERFWGKTKYRYIRYRDLMILGRRVFDSGEHVSWAQRGAWLTARALLPFHRSYAHSFNKTFDPYDRKYFVSFRSPLT
jgi:glycosyltransferase involved in cell wall biosynthesis